MLKETEIFVNRSKSGKAIVFYINDMGYTLNFDKIHKLEKGEYKAVTLTEIVKEEDEVKQE